MLSLQVHYGLAIDPLQLDVCPIIIWLVIFCVTRLEDEGFDVVGLEYMNGPVFKISYMAVIEEYLWIDIFCSTDCLEMNRWRHPYIPVHIPR